jgi:hypothetical protein
MLPTYTCQDVINRVTRQFGDESGVQITTTDILRYIDAAQFSIVKDNRVLKGTATSNSVAGNGTIHLTTDVGSANILGILRILYDGNPLQYLSFNEATEYIQKNDNSNSTPGAPLYWYEFGTDIFLYPIPAASGDPITINYDAFPTKMTSTAQTLLVPDSYFEIIVKSCMKEAYEMDDDWMATQFKAGEVSTDMSALHQDAEGYNRATYPLITLIDENDEVY